MLVEIKDYYRNLYKRSANNTTDNSGKIERYGWSTNSSSKPQICAMLKTCLREGLYYERCREAVDEMKDGGYRNLPDSTVTLYLAWLAHFVPDIHCPSHVIYNFRSTNYWVNVGGGEKVLFHGIWDHVPDRYGIHDWSPGEYCDHLTRNLSRKEVKAIAMDGDVLGWVHQNAVECLVAYDIVRPDTLTDVDCYNATVLADRQLVRGGIRLACLLNMIFG